MNKALVLFSGGIDSTTLLNKTLNESNEVIALGILYGQKHQIELEAAREVIEYYQNLIWEKEYYTVSNLDYKVIDLSLLFLNSGSALTDFNVKIPETSYSEQGFGPVNTVVPFRNATFISVATIEAIKNNCDSIYIGVHADDSLNWAYPDCSPEFIGAMSNAVYIGSYEQVRLIAPFVHMTKREIVRIGLENEVPYQLTHSCYKGLKPACGKCATCRDRQQAFIDNGTVDPIEYQMRI